MDVLRKGARETGSPKFFGVSARFGGREISRPAGEGACLRDDAGTLKGHCRGMESSDYLAWSVRLC